MSVYMIIQSSVKNEEKYNQYITQVSPIVEKYGGCYHVRGENIRSLGSWNPERVIVIEFQSEDQIQNSGICCRCPTTWRRCRCSGDYC